MAEERTEVAIAALFADMFMVRTEARGALTFMRLTCSQCHAVVWGTGSGHGEYAARLDNLLRLAHGHVMVCPRLQAQTLTT